MEELIINETTVTPYIKLDYASNKYIITGKSLPENPAEFYTPVLDWFRKLESSIPEGKSIKLEVMYDYFNTASSKLFLEITDILAEIKEKEVEVCVEWQYTSGDENMIESGEMFQELVEIPFIMKEV